MEVLWGRDKNGKLIKTEHWSLQSLRDRAKTLDKNMELLVLERYDMRNFAVHSGLAGIMNFSKERFGMMCAQALERIGTCMLVELHILGWELKLAVAIPNYAEILAELDRVQVYAFADKTLQALGEPVRHCVHPGAPSKIIQASGGVENLLQSHPRSSTNDTTF